GGWGETGGEAESGRLVRQGAAGSRQRAPKPPTAPHPAPVRQQVPVLMRRDRVGLWLVGGFGGVGTTIALGLSAMARGLVDRTGLVTDLARFRDLPLPEPGDFVLGGHDIRRTSYAESAEEFRRNSGVYESDWIAACADDLARATEQVRPGTSFGSGRAIAQLGHWAEAEPPHTAQQAVDQIAADLESFVVSQSIDHLIVLNVASTEPPFHLGEIH